MTGPQETAMRRSYDDDLAYLPAAVRKAQHAFVTSLTQSYPNIGLVYPKPIDYTVFDAACLLVARRWLAANHPGNWGVRDADD